MIDSYGNRRSQRNPLLGDSPNLGKVVEIKPKAALLTPQKLLPQHKLPPLAMREEFDSFNNAQFNTVVIGQ